MEPEVPVLYAHSNDFFINLPIVIGNIDEASNILSLYSEDPLVCHHDSCYCCPEDGSGQPIIDLEWNDGIVSYTVHGIDTGIPGYEYFNFFIGPEAPFGSHLSGIFNILLDYGQVYLTEDNNSGTFNTSSSSITRCIGDLVPFLSFVVYAANKCGIVSKQEFCWCANCYLTVEIDCDLKKIILSKFCNGGNYETGYTTDYFTEITYYNLGQVAESYNFTFDNKCGPPFNQNYDTLCIYSKNSIVWEFSNIPDTVMSERTTVNGNLTIYESVEYTGLSAFNGSFVLPLYIQDCNDGGNIAYNYSPFVVGSGTIRNIRIDTYDGSPPLTVTDTTFNVNYFFSTGFTPAYTITSYTKLAFLGPPITCTCNPDVCGDGWCGVFGNIYSNNSKYVAGLGRWFLNGPTCNNEASGQFSIGFDISELFGNYRSYYANL